MPETRPMYDPVVDPERRALVDRVVAAFETLMHRGASAHAPEFLAVGVTMSQAKVLYLVQADPGLRMSELSARLGVSLSTVSGLVDRLVDQGLLTRQDDPADRRQVVLGLTDAAATQLEHLRELNAGQVRALLSSVDAAGLAVVERALDILAQAAGALGGAAPAPVTSHRRALPPAVPSPAATTGGTRS